VRPSEVEDEIPEDGDLVTLSYYPPGDTTGGRRFFMERTDFEKLAQGVDMAQVLQSARAAQSLEEGPRRRGRRRAARAPQIEKIDYASPQHAGEPHRGRATEAEQEYVRANLSEVNVRLTRDGHRPIDPKDPKMAQRYGFEPSQAA
jgi:hypothetical protein